jgi:hypothetical protein
MSGVTIGEQATSRYKSRYPSKVLLASPGSGNGLPVMRWFAWYTVVQRGISEARGPWLARGCVYRNSKGRLCDLLTRRPVRRYRGHAREA